MPELPDVEVFKRYIDSTSLHQPIDSVDTSDGQLFATTLKKVRRELRGKQLEETKRIGKHLFVRYGQDAWLMLHFGMTGALQYYKDGNPPDYARLLLHFKNGYHLAYTSARKLGEIDLTNAPETFAEKHDLGPDALSLSREAFLEKMQSKRGGIKSALMDQSFLAGIGNVYSDEILFQSRIHPKAKVDELSDKQLNTLYDKMQEVLVKCIDLQADPARMPDHYLTPRREEGADCPGGKGKVEKITVNGRSCYYCPEEQRN